MLNRDRVDHILRAAGVVTGRKKFVLIGSAAIAAWRSDIPESMATSRDVDLFAYDAPDADDVSDMLDASLGQASPFDAEFGYYCDGVGRETAIMPADWESRAKLYASPAANGVEAIVPEPNDRAPSKLAAWRPKDISWLRTAVQQGIVSIDLMRARLVQMPDRAGPGEQLAARLAALA
jgi:hypothetical protein